MNDTLAVALGYLIGSIPFAYLIVRRHGVDLRRVGSLNVGATNVLRAAGPGEALLAMTLDVMKGVAAVLVAERLTTGLGGPVAAGVASMLGHIYPVWLGFHGGKGVATAAGVFIVLTPFAVLCAAAVFLAVAVLTRYVSAGSLAGVATFVAAMFVIDAPLLVIIGGVTTAFVIVVRHRGNIARLWAGTERRVGMGEGTH
jgi:glycerol-3-phosphate acyltransferase PlsY